MRRSGGRTRCPSFRSRPRTSGWAAREKFQRTGGVLRLVGAVIHELGEGGDASLMILPASVPIDGERVQVELVRYLEDGWTPVIASDVDGENALPLQLDRENQN